MARTIVTHHGTAPMMTVVLTLGITSATDMETAVVTS